MVDGETVPLSQAWFAAVREACARTGPVPGVERFLLEWWVTDPPIEGLTQLPWLIGVWQGRWVCWAGTTPWAAADERVILPWDRLAFEQAVRFGADPEHPPAEPWTILGTSQLAVPTVILLALAGKPASGAVRLPVTPAPAAEPEPVVVAEPTLPPVPSTDVLEGRIPPPPGSPEAEVEAPSDAASAEVDAAPADAEPDATADETAAIAEPETAAEPETIGDKETAAEPETIGDEETAAEPETIGDDETAAEAAPEATAETATEGVAERDHHRAGARDPRRGRGRGRARGHRRARGRRRHRARGRRPGGGAAQPAEPAPVAPIEPPTTTPAPTLPPASWYTDPTGRHQLRYWDGVRWTEHAADQATGQVIDPI